MQPSTLAEFLSLLPGRRVLVVGDVTGAGDTVIATLAVLLAAGTPLEQAMVAANLAAGVAVGKRGTAAVTAAELRQAMAEQ
jgi:D-beta-D-heptose 7-phosphate kinase/D-beta-D-heptose 1-phosphate adenosyltransferase